MIRFIEHMSKRTDGSNGRWGEHNLQAWNLFLEMPELQLILLFEARRICVILYAGTNRRSDSLLQLGCPGAYRL